ncbi:MAG: hypothetical protein Fur0023_00080 [Bacteroidia bacterium]
MKNTDKSSSDLNFEKVWLLFQETDRKFQETDKKIQETERIIKEAFQETDKKFQETDRKLAEYREESRRLEKNILQIQKETRDIIASFTDEIGEIVEALMEAPLVKLFNERGIPVQQTYQRALSRRTGRDVEIDIIAENGKEVIAVEVKTTLRKRDIDKFVETLKIFKQAFPKYKDNVVYGAIAFLSGRRELTRYAYKKGLFVIKVLNENAEILNDKKFKPTAY